LGFVDDDQDDDDDDDDEGHLAAAAAVTRSRVVFYAVKGAQTRESARGDSPSYYNPIEANALVELLAGWLDRDAARGDDADAAKDGGAGASAVYASPRLRASDVGVIAPYRAQVLRLRLLLRGRGLGAVRVGTVDDYQGQEEKVVFISATATRTPHPALLRAAGMTTGGGQLGFLACPRRFNVATTRAKCLNVVVGHPGALSHWPHWAALLRRCALAGACFGPGMDDGSDVGQNRQNADRRGGSYPHPGPGGDDVGAAVAALAELSLLGGGAAEAEEDDDAMARSAFSEEQPWRVAL
jgi:putative helicase MOV10L1